MSDVIVMGQEDMKLVLRVLRSGGYYVPGMSDDLVLVWHQALQRFGFADCEAAAQSWAETEDEFPTLNRFIDHVNRTAHYRDAIRRGLAKPFGGGLVDVAECPECGMTKGRGQVMTTDEEGRQFWHPCPLCDPDQYARWRGGHLDINHDHYRCDDPGCKAIVKKRRH